jgi:hypothetical protein
MDLWRLVQNEVSFSCNAREYSKTSGDGATRVNTSMSSRAKPTRLPVQDPALPISALVWLSRPHKMTKYWGASRALEFAALVSSPAQ